MRLNVPDSIGFISNLSIFLGNDVYGIPVKKPMDQLMSINFRMPDTKEIYKESHCWLSVQMKHEDLLF